MNQENATLQSADPKPPTRDKIRWFWFAFDIILILFIIAFIEFLIFALPLEGYYFGLSQGKIGNGTTLFATSLLLSPVALIAFLSSYVHFLAQTYKKQEKSDYITSPNHLRTNCIYSFPLCIGRAFPKELYGWIPGTCTDGRY